jgi:hypothetical protein
MPFLGTTGGGSVKQYGGQANLGYFIKNSLRFRSSASAYLNRTLTTPTNNKLFTWSGWVKRSNIGVWNDLFGAGAGTNGFGFNTTWNDNGLAFFTNNVTGDYFYLVTTQVFRDPSAWYHIVLSVDTTQATASNRAKIYVNGNQITAFNSAVYQSQNSSLTYNSATTHYLGCLGGPTRFLDGYLTEINFIDGQALTPSSFGKTDAATNQWIPKKFAGTYGTNGFYLKFADASAATAAAIGKDSSSNGNNWTPNNISVTAGVTYDAMIDSPTLSGAASNYCVLNPLSALNSTASDGNLKGTLNAASVTTDIYGTMASGTTGKFYWETTYVSRSGNSALTTGGVRSDVFGAEPSGTGGFGYYSVGGQVFVNGSTVATYATYTTGDVIGIALDLTNSQVSFYKNNTLQGTVSIASGYSWISGYANGTSSGNQVITVNFGQQPFTYTPPSGFKSLNTFNLP